MKIGVQFDENGLFVGDVLEGMTVPDGHTLYAGPVPDGLYKPMLVNGEVVEGLTAAEIAALAQPPIPSTDDRLLALEQMMNALYA